MGSERLGKVDRGRADANNCECVININACKLLFLNIHVLSTQSKQRHRHRCSLAEPLPNNGLEQVFTINKLLNIYEILFMGYFKSDLVIIHGKYYNDLLIIRAVFLGVTFYDPLGFFYKQVGGIPSVVIISYPLQTLPEVFPTHQDLLVGRGQVAVLEIVTVDVGVVVFVAC